MSALSLEAFKQRVESTQWGCGRGDCNEVEVWKPAYLGPESSGSS